jgi:hypothetical protein
MPEGRTEFAAERRFYNSWPDDLAGVPFSVAWINLINGKAPLLGNEARNGAPSGLITEVKWFQK